MGVLRGKVGIVYGVTNHLSIGWGIAQAWHNAGAKVAISVENARMRSKVEKLVQEQLGYHIITCNLNNDKEIMSSLAQASCVFDAKEDGKVDMIVHSVAHAPREALASVRETSREAFLSTFETSVFSLIALANASAPMMSNGGSLISLTFDGSSRVVPGYGIMGPAKAALESANRYLAHELGPQKIRVNTISAGALNTVSARAIKDFHVLRSNAEASSPLDRRLETKDVGEMAVFLASDMAQGITGQTLYVDNGRSIMSN